MVVYRSFPTSNNNLIQQRHGGLRVVYRSFPTSNHNHAQSRMVCDRLYIVLFLHQTTTFYLVSHVLEGCISFFSYIKPQLFSYLDFVTCVVYRSFPTSNHNYQKIYYDHYRLYIVLFLHQNTTLLSNVLSDLALYIVLFLHQTTTSSSLCACSGSCISFFSYIKPQRILHNSNNVFVVYRSFPTSNHN